MYSLLHECALDTMFTLDYTSVRLSTSPCLRPRSVSFFLGMRRRRRRIHVI